MGLYYLDPEREPRDCPTCQGVGRLNDERHPSTGTVMVAGTDCFCCNGTGRLGVEGAEPDVEVRYREHRSLGWDNHGHYWRRDKKPPDAGWRGPYPTKAAALEAARKARREVK